jgi:hypothetical protein
LNTIDIGLHCALGVFGIENAFQDHLSRKDRPYPGDIFRRELLGDKTIKQGDVLKPTAIIVLKEVALDGTARLLVGRNSNEASTAIRRADSIFRESASDLVGLIMTGATGVLPDLLLPGVVRRDGKGHELLESHAVFGIDLVQLRRYRRQPQPLLDDRRRDEMARRDTFFAEAGIAQSLERSELVERMQALVRFCAKCPFWSIRLLSLPFSL